ncbi:YueC family protein [Parageobacillus toebii NBRC 107807]|nr:DUF5383 family protein [Parageobacillus toebii]MED4968973.1 DUF5383 family protein [Parageobacillus toebii]QIQ31886.1 YueC family protein [Parageobacillus toebii NBRC 107807]
MIALCRENRHVKQREKSLFIQLFFFCQRKQTQQSVPSRQQWDKTERTSSSLLPWLFGFFILGFLIILLTVIVPRIKKFVL